MKIAGGPVTLELSHHGYWDIPELGYTRWRGWEYDEETIAERVDNGEDLDEVLADNPKKDIYFYVHQLAYIAWNFDEDIHNSPLDVLRNGDGKYHVDHIDDCPLNNSEWNLDAKEPSEHSSRGPGREWYLLDDLADGLEDAGEVGEIDA